MRTDRRLKRLDKAFTANLLRTQTAPAGLTTERLKKCA